MRVGRWVGVSVALAVVAGCSGEDIAESIIEQGLEREGGGDVDVDLDLHDGGISIETEEGEISIETDEDGNVVIEGEGEDGDVSIRSEDGETVIESDDGTMVIEQGGAGLPEGFPSDVPLPDALTVQISQSSSMDGRESWFVGGEVDAESGEVLGDLVAALESAGFGRQMLTETPEGAIFSYDDGTWQVAGTVGSDGSGTAIALTVGPSSSG